MHLLRISIHVFFLMLARSFSVHPNPRRNEIIWDDLNKDLSLDSTTSMMWFNGSDSGPEPKMFERSREAKSHQLSRYTEVGEMGQMRVYNVGVLMASHLGKCLVSWFKIWWWVGRWLPDSPFDLERCGPAVDLALDEINKVFLKPHNITLLKKKGRLVQKLSWVINRGYFRKTKNNS